MMTTEQKQIVVNYLKNRNLPLDLRVEIEDHICEQIEDRMFAEDIDFETAFGETKNLWKKELYMKTSFFAGEKRTKIHRETIKATQNKISTKALKIFLIPFSISVLLLFVNRNYSASFLLFVNVAAVLLGVLAFAINFKMFSGSNTYKKRKISYLQNGLQLLFISGGFIPILVFVNYSERFNRFYNAFLLALKGDFTFDFFLSVIIFYGYSYAALVGFLYFIEYRKTVKILEQKINFKL